MLHNNEASNKYLLAPSSPLLPRILNCGDTKLVLLVGFASKLRENSKMLQKVYLIYFIANARAKASSYRRWNIAKVAAPLLVTS